MSSWWNSKEGQKTFLVKGPFLSRLYYFHMADNVITNHLQGVQGAAVLILYEVDYKVL